MSGFDGGFWPPGPIVEFSNEEIKELLAETQNLIVILKEAVQPH